jgi:hypothetical protein
MSAQQISPSLGMQCVTPEPALPRGLQGLLAGNRDHLRHATLARLALWPLLALAKLFWLLHGPTARPSICHLLSDAPLARLA